MIRLLSCLLFLILILISLFFNFFEDLYIYFFLFIFLLICRVFHYFCEIFISFGKFLQSFGSRFNYSLKYEFLIFFSMLAVDFISDNILGFLLNLCFLIHNFIFLDFTTFPDFCNSLKFSFSAFCSFCLVFLIGLFFTLFLTILGSLLVLVTGWIFRLGGFFLILIFSFLLKVLNYFSQGLRFLLFALAFLFYKFFL